MITIVGAGSWGTALAIHLARHGTPVRLCARSTDVVEGMRARRRNPGICPMLTCQRGSSPQPMPPPRGLASLIVIAVRRVLRRGPGQLGAVSAPVVSATKGFDPVRHRRMSEVVAGRWPTAGVAVLSGPTFAREVALGQPTAAVIACRDDALAAELQRRLGSREFRLYTNRDVVGVEGGGALKNVIAVATGLADGLGLGENARAALITRGLAEITRLAVTLGGEPATLAGLAGLGDLVLTSTGTLSRNRALGMALARGESREGARQATRMVAEGVPTVRAALALAAQHGTTLPIATEVAAVLFDGKPPAEALASLLGARRRGGRAGGGRHA
jgi:glycerol-3-phosphate dehydrogenase (NAD(P)+)